MFEEVVCSASEVGHVFPVEIEGLFGVLLLFEVFSGNEGEGCVYDVVDEEVVEFYEIVGRVH